MAKTLLDAVNETLKRVKVVDTGNVGLLTSLTNISLQHEIDVAVQVINEGMDQLYSYGQLNMPKSQNESSITLVNGSREYSLATDLVRVHWPMIDRVNTQYLFEWTEGYDRLLLLDPQQDYTGLPIWAMISPITGLLHVDRAPTTLEAGRIYFYEYEKDTVLTNATDAVPFTNATFRAMVPVWVQLWKREERGEFDEALYKLNMGRAARFCREDISEPNNSYSPREQ